MFVVIIYKNMGKLANKISQYNRSRKYKYFIGNFSLDNTTTILDIGFTNNDYSEEANFLEKHYPYLDNITALGIESDHIFKKLFPQVKVVLYDGSFFPFQDNSFDIGWSNAVIEHVGNRDNQIRFVKEMLRTCGQIFFTTPNRKFPFDLHTKLPFIHWLPKKYFDKCLIFFGQKWASGDYMNLLTKKDIVNICKEAGSKSFSIKRNRFFGFTMDFVICASE